MDKQALKEWQDLDVYSTISMIHSFPYKTTTCLTTVYYFYGQVNLWIVGYFKPEKSYMNLSYTIPVLYLIKKF